MINLARQGFANPFLAATGASFQPGPTGSVGRCPLCGNAVSSTSQHQTTGLNPLEIAPNLGQQLGQQMGGFPPNPFGISQAAGLGQVNPFAQLSGGFQQSVNPFAQLSGGFQQTINPLAGQVPPGAFSGQQSHQSLGRPGAYGIDPRLGFNPMAQQQFGYADPNAVPGLINPSMASDPINSIWSQQLNPATQQLPIRPLIGGQQGFGSQSFGPGVGTAITPWNDPYRAFIEAQLLSQLAAANPLYQVQRAYGGVPESTGSFSPFGVGQQFNPLFANLPFYG